MLRLCGSFNYKLYVFCFFLDTKSASACKHTCERTFSFCPLPPSLFFCSPKLLVFFHFCLLCANIFLFHLFFSLALYPQSFLVFCLALLFLFSSMPSPLSFLLLSPPLSSGQLISDDVSEIFTRFTNDYFTRYGNTLSTKSANAQYDDSYLGNYTITYTPSVRFS